MRREHNWFPSELWQVLREPQGPLQAAALGEWREVVGDKQDTTHSVIVSVRPACRCLQVRLGS
jgi:hypothetical protein